MEGNISLEKMLAYQVLTDGSYYINDSTETIEKRMRLLEEYSDVLEHAINYLESHPELLQKLFDEQMEELEEVIKELIAVKTIGSKK